MEDADSESDAEMADSSRTMGPRGRTFRTMSTQTSLGNRESDPPFSRFGGRFPDSRFPIQVGRELESGNGKRAVSQFCRDRARESGPRGRHAEDFLVWTHGFNLNLPVT
jgi:hypothetical protein